MKLLEDIIIEGKINNIIPSGTVIEAVFDLDTIPDEKAEAQDSMINIIQKWIDNNKTLRQAQLQTPPAFRHCRR